MIRYLWKLISSKIFIAFIIIFSQILFVLFGVYFLSQHYLFIRALLLILGVILTLHVINRDGDDNTYKIGWVIVILIEPILGGLLYLMLGNARIPTRLRNLGRKQLKEQEELYYYNDFEVINEVTKSDDSIGRSIYYLSNTAGFPIYKNTISQYLHSGEAKYRTMLEELKKAKKFIMLEYFIIEKGTMWDSILEILVQKVKEGVEVFVLYDDFGCITSLQPYYDDYLRSLGINCQVFNPIRLTLAIQMNYRDHRKLCIVDGRIAITGGINLADEYINVKKRFGHWRDSSVIIKGPAVWNFTLAFLRFYSYASKKEIDYFKYRVLEEEFEKVEDGYVIPYTDSPTDVELVGHSAHLNMITNAKKYLYIQSPYVIIDQNMRDSLILAAKSGVDVRIMIPHIPDKKLVYILTRDNCRRLAKYGVKIYEYLPGFVHSKTFVSDDTSCLVGSVNMDYRSYYLHFECGVFFYKSKVVDEVKQDFLNTLKKCKEVKYEDYENASFIEKVLRYVLNVFSPML